ncbi:Na+/H+ antiporter NhaC family protein [Chryseobacterium sp.]|uniref:Na+/H+ antiporter NhaC family protein n=1 Tax=Chryseobacterium sp. TaxID=1871047 RepID=UPI002899197A|nr:Na+/H+ antiporter NhaC family protein [Chryseobacterium sp.]
MRKYPFISILPLLVFVIFFLGCGIYFNDFYLIPSPIAALVGIVAVFILFKSNINEKTETFLKGCGDQKILTMCIIYLLAGAFATVSKESGSIDTVVNLGMASISPQFFPAGIFIIASLLSFASGTSVGSIVTLGPIVIAFAEQSQLPLGIAGGALLAGSMFGDNLSVISDTTIAATQSLGCEMKDKFKENAKIAIPAALISIVILIFVGFQFDLPSATFQNVGDYNLVLVFPYLLVIILSVMGINVFVSLFLGILFSGALGLFYGTFDSIGLAKHTYAGFTSMTEIFLLSLLTGGLAALVEHAGGIDYIMKKINRVISGKKSAVFGIGGLVSIINLCIANNTISILISGKIAKKISDKYALKPQKVASVLDIFACYVQGLIPYGAQILILISLSKFKIQYTDLLLHSYYLHILMVFTIIYMIF